MKENNKHKGPHGRSDKPSGRQASLHPEHNGEFQDPASLHQGQGPDFQTQDEVLQEQNEGVQDFKEAGYLQANIPGSRNKQRFTDIENPDEADKARDEDDDELSSRHREKPSVEDDPDETRREFPKL